MDFFKFLISKTFLKNLIAAIILTFLLVFALKLYLNSYTNHNDYHLVPELKGKSIEQANKILKDRKMKMVIIDTLEYNPEYPKFSVVEQEPRKGDKVKLGRKIYVKINNGAYSNISFPNILGKTERQAKTLLKTSGLRIGKITKRPYFAEIVLKAICQKDTLKAGMPIPKTSKIDLIIGDGKTSVEGSNNDESSNNGNEGEAEKDKQVEKVLNDVLGN